MERHESPAIRKYEIADIIYGDRAEAAASVVRSWDEFNGPSLRRAFVLDRAAEQVYDGDLRRAAMLLQNNSPTSRDKSWEEIVTSNNGMLLMRDIINRLSTKSKSDGIGSFLTAIESDRLETCSLIIHLLPITWGLSEDEFAMLLDCKLDQLKKWKFEETKISRDCQSNIFRILRFYKLLLKLVCASDHYSFWRFIWPYGSIVGHRSLITAIKTDGLKILDLVECFLWVYWENRTIINLE